MTGTLIVHTGPMGSGKSAAAIATAQKKREQGKNVQMLKPSIDTRSTSISSRNGASAPCELLPIDNSQRFLYFVNEALEGNLDVVIIDEFQFFTNYDYVNEILRLVRIGVEVHVCGLDLTSEMKPFGFMPLMMAYADVVYKHKAICDDCGMSANLTYADFKKKGEVVIDVKDAKYLSLCLSCYVNRSYKLSR